MKANRGFAQLGPWMATLYVAVGMIMPTCGLLVGLGDEPTWQSGQPHDHAKLLLQPKVTWPFWPFFAFAYLAMVALIRDFPKYCQASWVRVGLGVGVLLGAHFTILFWALFEVSYIGLVIVAFVLLVGEVHVDPVGRPSVEPEHFLSDLTVLGTITLTTMTLLLLLAGGFWVEERSLLWGILIGPVTFATLVGWHTALLVTFAMALARSRNGWRQAKKSVKNKSLIGWIVGLGLAYGSAWSLAITQKIHEYEKLPTQPPPEDCYIATAACKGHRAWVRSIWVRPNGQNPFLVNSQLQTLKIGELVLQALMPRMHRSLRRIYDSWGPRLAARIQNPWCADMAYVALIPVEWATRLALTALRVRCEIQRWR